MVYIPDTESVVPGVVVCHPHPLYGGNMDNEVVTRICESLAAASIAALKFNFKGVGGSQGNFRVENERQEDVKAAISFLSNYPKINPDKLGLGGYSAGAAWGLAAACADPRIKALAGISPPLSLADFGFLSNCIKPKLLVSGNRDEHIPVNSLQEYLKNLSQPVELKIIEGADHFWNGYEDTLAEKVAGFFNQYLT